MTTHTQLVDFGRSFDFEANTLNTGRLGELIAARLSSMLNGERLLLAQVDECLALLRAHPMLKHFRPVHLPLQVKRDMTELTLALPVAPGTTLVINFSGDSCGEEVTMTYGITVAPIVTPLPPQYTSGIVVLGDMDADLLDMAHVFRRILADKSSATPHGLTAPEISVLLGFTPKKVSA